MLSRDLVAATTEPLILSILSREKSYGYALIKEILALSGGKVNWTEGMLYPVLHRLENDGLISSLWEESETGRKRKYYKIKKKGLTRLQSQWNEWDLAHKMISSSRGVAHV